MECNKEEAIRAKEIAETKMQNKDFAGARKIALKAQQLYPALENISQLLMVCDVHLSAESKGNEKNFYDILKIESTADEISIKKQYRKFALLLHPDKNKFAGATDAFKLIGEAQRVLLDRGTRSLHDAKLKNWKPNRGPPPPQRPPQQQPSNNPNIRTQPWAQAPFMGKTNPPFTTFTPQQQQPPKPPQSTFWTICPHCVVRYQYYRDVINKVLTCQRCKKSFTGYEIKEHATVNRTAWDFKPNDGRKVEPQRTSFETRTRESVAKSGTSEVGKDRKVESKSSAKVKVNSKRKKQIDDSSESSDSDTSSESEEEDIIDENGDVKVTKDFGISGENLRRSTRSKTNISYKENLSDDDTLGSSSKKAKSNGSFRANADPILEKEASKTKSESSSKPLEEGNLNKVKAKETENGTYSASAKEKSGKESVEANGETSPDPSFDGPELYDYPDPDFNDFDNDRREDCFAVGQIWAVYDTLDGMPRFYARVSRIISTSKFNLRIQWLEASPEDEEENKWVDAGLPVSCGTLRKGDIEIAENRLMFSHKIDWEKGSKRDTFKIYPQKGETWALFKNWDMSWHSNLDSKRKYEFEFAEILSEYDEDTGVSIAYLGKVKGFTCLFVRRQIEGVDSFQIPRSQLFRFSHRVPSFPLSGEERDDVPKNSFELDPVSLPPKLEEIDIPKDPKVEVETVVLSESDSPECEVKDSMELNSEGSSSSSEESPEEYEIPEPEFFNFDDEKSPAKFQPGQFWALYSDEDGLPKYYAFVKKIDHLPNFKLHINWLTSCPAKSTVKYTDKRIPIGCGVFKHSKGFTLSYTDTGTFSHQVTVEPTDKMDEFAIYPRNGEVWGVYKNWKSKMTRSDLKTCEYDIVEVIEENDLYIKGVVLEMVSGHNSVFRAQINNGSLATVQIGRAYLLKFSHQVPAFRLTRERGGSLKGYWELDPAALPTQMFNSS